MFRYISRMCFCTENLQNIYGFYSMIFIKKSYFQIVFPKGKEDQAFFLEHSLKIVFWLNFWLPVQKMET